MKPGNLVLDIGAGSGLLAMMAVRAGAGHVVSCEMIKPLADKAVEIVARNGMSQQITVVAKKSTQLLVGGDLPERADLLVAEIFDVGLVGEHALSSIADARSRLLKPNAPIVPGRATVYATLIESQSLWNRDRVNTIRGFDLSAFNDFCTWPHYLQVLLMHHEHDYLCEPFVGLEFDFRTVAIERSPRSRSVEVEQDGTCHGIAYWFHLDLGQGSAELDTAPRNEETHWMQAFQALDKPIQVFGGETINVSIRHNDRAIFFELMR